MEGLKGHLFSICILCVFLLVGKFLRVRSRVLRRLFLPSSIVAGFLALALGPYGAALLPRWIVANWAELPGVLINVVFASLFLGVSLPGARKIWHIGGPQLCFGMFAGFGQYLVALLVTTLLLAPVFGVPAIFACILEIGFAGGHGTAAGMSQVFADLGYPAGSALAQMSATVGIITAVVGGIALINFAIRKSYCVHLNEENGIPRHKRLGLIPESHRYSIATATVATEAIEPLSFHFAIVAVAILIGWGALALIQPLHPALAGFPLFPLAMVGGLVVQAGAARLGVAAYFDRGTFDRITGFSLDTLVIAAIASIRLDLFLQNVWPFVILMAVGILWLMFCVLVLGPRMFPTFWFEKSVTEYGMQSGVTAIGLLLLRLVDPEYKTDAATAFGLKQMIYEPLLGGGLITATAPILILSLGTTWAMILSALIMFGVLLLSIANGWTRRHRWDAEAPNHVFSTVKAKQERA